MKKKLIALLLCCVMALSMGLVGCDTINKPTDKDDPIVTPGGDDFGDQKPDDGKPDDGKPDDGKPDDGKPDDGKPDDVKYTVLTRSVELLDNVKKLPAVSEVMKSDGSATAVASAKNGARPDSLGRTSDGIDGDQLDFTVPDVNYKNIPAYNAHYQNMWDSIDNKVGQCKQIVHDVISAVRQLNVWVRVQDSTQYMLEYDRTCDTVTVHIRQKFDADTTYLRIKSYYNAVGAMAMEIIETAYIKAEDKISYTSCIDYIEGERWYYTLDEGVNYNQNGYGHVKFIVFADLTGDTPVITQLNYIDELNTQAYELATGNQVDLYSIYVQPSLQCFSGDCPIVVSPRQPAYEKIGEDGRYKYAGYSNPGSMDIYDKDGYNICKVHGFAFKESGLSGEKPLLAVLLSLYKLDGWDKFVTTPDWNTKKVLTIGDKTYTNNIGDGYIDHAYEFEGEHGSILWRPGLLTGGSTVEPALEMSTYGCDDMSALLKEFLPTIGLSVKDENTYAAIDYISDYDMVVKNWSAMGISDFTIFSKEQFNDLYDACHKELGKAEVLELCAQPDISADEQVEESEIFAMLDVTVTGKATLDTESGHIDLSDIAVNVGESIILQSDREYALVFVWYGEGSVTDAVEVGATYVSGDLDIKGPADELDPLLFRADGAYSLKFFIAKKENGGYTRMSVLFDIAGADSECGVITESLTDENEKYLIFDVADIKITLGDSLVLIGSHTVKKQPKPGALADLCMDGRVMPNGVDFNTQFVTFYVEGDALRDDSARYAIAVVYEDIEHIVAMFEFNYSKGEIAVKSGTFGVTCQNAPQGKSELKFCVVQLTDDGPQLTSNYMSFISGFEGRNEFTGSMVEGGQSVVCSRSIIFTGDGIFVEHAHSSYGADNNTPDDAQ